MSKLDILPDWMSCCIVHEGKRALDKEWTLHPVDREKLLKALNNGHGIGLMPGPLSNDVVVLDLDDFDEEMYRKADQILPSTECMAGHSGYYRKHRIYRLLDTEFSDDLLPKKNDAPGKAITRKAMDAGEYRRFPGKKVFKGQRNGKIFKIEALGAGNQAVMPPSKHPSGAIRQFEGGVCGVPREVFLSELYESCEKVINELADPVSKKPSKAAKPIKKASAKKQQTPIANEKSFNSSLDGELPSEPHPTDLKRFNETIKNIGEAVIGDGGFCKTYQVCASAGDHLIHPDIAWPIIRGWNEGNKNPWDENELKEKLDASYRQRNSKLGSKSVLRFAEYSAEDSVYNAVVFTNNHYPKGLIAYGGEYYAFRNNRWECLAAMGIEHEVQREFEEMSGYKQYHIGNVVKAVKWRAPQCDHRSPPFSIANHNEQSKNILVFQNGQLEIVIEKKEIKLVFSDINPDVFFLSQLSYDYNPEAECPEWLRFLDTLWENSAEEIRLLQEWLGYCLIYSYQWQKIMLMVGLSRSGKGTIGNLMQKLIGKDDSCALQLDTLSNRFGLQDMYGKRIAVLGDAHTVDRKNRAQVLTMLLSIAGHDVLLIDGKFKKPFSAHIEARITMLANSMPEFMDNSDALLNRLLVLTFRQSFAGREDVLLLSRLETELSGILNWALEGLRRLFKQGDFTKTRSGQGKLREIRRINNPIYAFIEDQCEYPAANEFVTKDHLYDSYRVYMRENGVRLELDKNRFLKALKEAAPELEDYQPRSVGGARPRCLKHITLKESEESFFEDDET